MNVLVSLFNSLPGAAGQGLIWGIMAIGVYITYKILDVADLTVDGSLATGGAVAALCVSMGWNPWLAVLAAVLAGMLAGLATGVLHTACGIPAILAGILTQLALYSINLRIAGRSNLPIFSKDTIFSNPFLTGTVPEALSPYVVTIILFVIVLACKLLLDAYLKTRSGYLLRAVGDNDVLVTSLAKDKGMVKIVGLAIANGFAAQIGRASCRERV